MLTTSVMPLILGILGAILAVPVKSFDPVTEAGVVGSNEK
jgi:hypothetical protein